MPAGAGAALSATIELDAVSGHHDVVHEETRRFAQDFNFDSLDDPFDERTRRHVLELLHGDAFMRGVLARGAWTSPTTSPTPTTRPAPRA